MGEDLLPIVDIVNWVFLFFVDGLKLYSPLYIKFPINFQHFQISNFEFEFQIALPLALIALLIHLPLEITIALSLQHRQLLFDARDHLLGELRFGIDVCVF